MGGQLYSNSFKKKKAKYTYLGPDLNAVKNMLRKKRCLQKAPRLTELLFLNSCSHISRGGNKDEILYLLLLQ